MRPFSISELCMGMPHRSRIGNGANRRGWLYHEQSEDPLTYVRVAMSETSIRLHFRSSAKYLPDTVLYSYLGRA